MGVKILTPTRIEAAGNLPKKIDEYVGRINSGNTQLSIAKMDSPTGWIEPFQTPDFHEFTVVLKGELHILVNGYTHIAKKGEAVSVPAGTRVQYSTPSEEGAEYVAVCIPAFSPNMVNREE